MNKERGYCIRNPYIFEFLKLTEDNVKQFIAFIYYDTHYSVPEEFLDYIYKEFQKFGDVIYYNDVDLCKEKGLTWIDEAEDCYNYEIGDYAVKMDGSGQPFRYSKEEFEEEYINITKNNNFYTFTKKN